MRRTLARLAALSLVLIAWNGALAEPMPEKFCMRSSINGMNGMMTGEEVRCRNGAMMFEERHTVMTMAGIRQEQHQRMIRRDGKIHTVDPNTGRLLSVINDPFAEFLTKDCSPGEMAAILNLQPTNEVDEVAGLRCRIYAGPGQTICLANNCLAPWMDGGGVIVEAQEITIGDGGPASSYEVPAGAPAATGAAPGGMPGNLPPNMPENVRKMLEGLGIQQQQ